MLLTAAGNNEVDRSTVSYAVDGDKKSKIFNIMFALGAPLLLCLSSQYAWQRSHLKLHSISAHSCAAHVSALCTDAVICCIRTLSHHMGSRLLLHATVMRFCNNDMLHKRCITLHVNSLSTWTLLNRSHLAPAGIIAFAFGDTILPEVQATVGGNAKKEMYKGISMGYSILLSSYMIVAIAGYWAFGYNVSLLSLVTG